jgi:putative membrane protein
MTELLTIATVALPLADHDWDPGPWFLLVPLLWIAVIATVVWLFCGRGRRGWGRPRGGVSPTEILDRRFAEGEISAEEYRDRRKALADGAA